MGSGATDTAALLGDVMSTLLDDTRMHVERNFPNMSYDIYLFNMSKDPDTIYVAQPLTMKQSSRGGEYHPPFVSLSESDAAQLMDRLWNAGVRPSNGAGSHATHEALNNHLEDLRRVAFKLLEIS